MHPEDQFAVRVLKSGASGYMTKESAPEELVGAIRKVLAGGRYVSAALGRKWRPIWPLTRQCATRTIVRPRVRCVAQDRIGQNREPDRRRAVVERQTISTYRTRILEKMEWRAMPS